MTTNEKIISLHGDHVPGDIAGDVVAELRRLLAEAERGELIAVAVATVRSNRLIGTGWTGVTGTRNELAAAVGILHHRIFENLMDEML